MNWIEIVIWRRTYDPDGRMSELQRMLIESVLKRGDVKRARQFLADWKIT